MTYLPPGGLLLVPIVGPGMTVVRYSLRS